MTTEAETSPVIILVDPQMGENIGAAARAMLNNGASTLRLVRPRDGWPSERAEAMSAGALELMPPVQVYDTVASAIADCHYVFATTARPRGMNKPVFTARTAAEAGRKRAASGQRVAYLFGGERAGLANDDVAQVHGILTIPLNPDFSSLNLGQAVLLAAYEWQQADIGDLPAAAEPPAPQEKFEELFARLETELDAGHFFRNPDQRPVMVRNLRTMLLRAEMTEQEARTFHGMLTALSGRKAISPNPSSRPERSGLEGSPPAIDSEDPSAPRR